MTSLSPRMSNLASAKNGLERPPAASLWPRPRPRKHSPRNRDVKRASHTKYELTRMSGTCSNRILLLQQPRGRNAEQPRTSETPLNDTQMTSLNPRMSNLTSAKNGLERPPAASLRPRPRPRKHAPRNRDVKRASHTKYELIWMSGTCSNRILLLQQPRGRNAKMRPCHTIWPTKSENNYFS